MSDRIRRFRKFMEVVPGGELEVIQADDGDDRSRIVEYVSVHSVALYCGMFECDEAYEALTNAADELRIKFYDAGDGKTECWWWWDRASLPELLSSLVKQKLGSQPSVKRLQAYMAGTKVRRASASRRLAKKSELVNR